MRLETWIAAAPDRVFEVLSQPALYRDWVVGTKEVRASDRSWPAVGSRFHHTVGAPGLSLRDSTRVVACERPRRLVLHASAGPLGAAEVELQLEPAAGGTRLSFSEGPRLVPTTVTQLPPLRWLVAARNGESLARLKELVEAGAGGS